MRLNSRVVLSVGLFAALSACEGSPSAPTPPPTCTYTLSVTSLSFGASGGSSSVAVTTTGTCAWSATADSPWITITSGLSGTGSGTVAITAAANVSPSVRTGTLTIAGQTVAVREDGLPACSVALSPGSALFSANPATGALTVTAPSYCPWTASSTAPWLTVTSGTQGQGNGTVGYAIDRNRETSTRTATIVVNEQTFALTQEGEEVSCDYAVSPVEFTPCMSSLEMTATVETRATCEWTATTAAPWLTIIEGRSGSGPGAVRFRATDNWDAPRQGIVEVRWPTVTAGQNLRVRQAGCSYAVTPATFSLAVSGSSGQFEVWQQSDPYTCGGPLQNACVWTAVSHASWITVTTSMPQQGDNPVRFTVAPNATGLSRTGTITVRDQVVTITQAGL